MALEKQITINSNDGAYAATVPANAVTVYGGNYSVGLSTLQYNVVDYDNVIISSIPKESSPK